MQVYLFLRFVDEFVINIIFEKKKRYKKLENSLSLPKALQIFKAQNKEDNTNFFF